MKYAIFDMKHNFLCVNCLRINTERKTVAIAVS